MTQEEEIKALQEKEAKRKQAQREAYQRWYNSPKGKEYMLKKKARQSNEGV